jgi:DNA-binding response OmpR family regulator
MQMLVADDDPVYRQVFTRFARKMGHDPIVACDGQEALELYAARRPRLVLSDWMMPRLTGVELCERIRSLAAPERPYVILVTCLSADEQVLEGFKAGADDYVAKPFVHAIFESRVNAALAVVQSAFGTEERIHRELIGTCQSALGHEHPDLRSSLEALSRIYVEQKAHVGDTEAERSPRLAIEEVNALEESSRSVAEEEAPLDAASTSPG